MQWLARLGYWARGVVYMAVGWLALAAAMGGQRAPSIGGTLSTMSAYPFGRALVAAIAGGLFGYAAWRTAQAVFDLHQDGRGTKGLLKRAATLVGAALHAGLGVLAALVALHWADAGGDGVAHRWASLVLDWPMGRWAVAGTGVGAVLMGLAQVAKARGPAFRDIAASATAMLLLRPLGRIGLAAKGIVFGTVGALFLFAAWQAEAADAGGLRAALEAIAAAPLGDTLLLALAGALESYGIFSVAKGWYHRLPGADRAAGPPPSPAGGGPHGRLNVTDRLRHTWEIVRTSLWFVPVLMGAAAVALAIALLTWGTGIPDDMSSYWLLYAGDAENARELLSALLSGMITMTSLVVSITMVVLTLAAGQIGPRLIRTFIQDRVTQAVLGLFLADILYLLTVFRTIDGQSLDDVPHLAVSAGTGITGLCLFVLLFYVHRLARSIIFDTVIQNIATELRHTVDRLLPEDPGDRARPADVVDDFCWVALDTDGYIQAIDLEMLVVAARDADAVIRFEVGPGDYVIGEGEHVAVHPAAAFTDALCDCIRAAVIVGSERTGSQDIAFGIRQLVEIATRALSPGLNDAFTALAVIDNLSSSLAHIFKRTLESPVRRDEDGAVRIVRVVPDHAGLVGMAFDQIRQAGSGHPAILIRLTEAIARLAPCVGSPALRQPLLEQLDMILAAGEQTITIPRDLDILRARTRHARDRLDR